MVQPIKKISGEVRLPGSKSLSNRALLLAALSEGTTVVENLLVRFSLTASDVALTRSTVGRVAGVCVVRSCLAL